jgi:hypothetical protein
VVVGGVLLAVAGATAAWLCLPARFRPPDFLPVCLSEYGDALPVRAWVRQDGEALLALPWKEHNAFASQTNDLFLSDLRAFLERAGRAPVVVYLNAVALPSAKGELCLLPVGASPDRPGEWVLLRQVFSILREKSSSSHKLLLLDVMQPLADASRGLLAEDAAARLHELLDVVLPADSRLSVLTACAAGQVSLPAEELGHSVFVHFLVLGLQGEAEGYGDHARKNGRVSVQELADYVKDQVDQWAMRHRGLRQTTRLRGAMTDFALATVGAHRQPPAAPPPDTEYPPWLLDAWKLHDGWWQDETFRLAPDVFLGLERALLRADRQWRDGIRQNLIQDDLDAQVRRLRRLLEEHPRPPQARPTSAAGALARDAKAAQAVTPKAIDEARQLAGRHVKAQQAAKTDPKDETLDADVTKFVKGFDGQPAALARVLFEAAAEEPLPQAALNFFRLQARKADLPSYAEVDYLARLADLPVKSADDWPGADAQVLLQVVRQAEQAAASDPRAQLWVREGRQKADKLRSDAEQLFFSPNPDRRREAHGPLQDALKAFRDVNSDLKTVSEALRCRDEARVLLPGLASLPAADPAWHNAWEQTRQLQDLLAPTEAPLGPAREEQVRQMLELTQKLRYNPDSLNSLLAPLEPGPFSPLIGRSSTGKLADAMVMTALLDTPRLTAEQRTQLWAARRALADRLETQRRAVPLTPWDAKDAKAAVQAQRQQALQRARRSLEVLRLQGVRELDEVDKALEQAVANPADEGRMQRLGKELRRAWQAAK